MMLEICRQWLQYAVKNNILHCFTQHNSIIWFSDILALANCVY